MSFLPEELVAPERFGQFVSVGVVGAAFDLAVSTGMRELGVYPELAVFVGIEVAIVVMFLLNDNWTFSDRGVGGVGAGLRRLAQSNVVRIGGSLVQLVTFSLLYRVPEISWSLSGIDAWFVVAKVGGIGVGMIVNYVAESLFTWRVTTE